MDKAASEQVSYNMVPVDADDGELFHDTSSKTLPPAKSTKPALRLQDECDEAPELDDTADNSNDDS